jgi:hypothetical protein
MDGNDFRKSGESFSSRVDRLVVDSGGEMYPDELGPAVAGALVYGGGGPEYMEVVGLVNEVDMLNPLLIANLDRSFFSCLMLSRSR